MLISLGENLENVEYFANTDPSELLEQSVLLGAPFFVKSDQIEDTAKVVYLWHDQTDFRRPGMTEHMANRTTTHDTNARLRPDVSGVYGTLVDDEHFETFSTVTNLRKSNVITLIPFAINSKEEKCTMKDSLMELFDWTLPIDSRQQKSQKRKKRRTKKKQKVANRLELTQDEKDRVVLYSCEMFYGSLMNPSRVLNKQLGYEKMMISQVHMKSS